MGICRLASSAGRAASMRAPWRQDARFPARPARCPRPWRPMARNLPPGMQACTEPSAFGVKPKEPPARGVSFRQNAIWPASWRRAAGAEPAGHDGGAGTHGRGDTPAGFPESRAGSLQPLRQGLPAKRRSSKRYSSKRSTLGRKASTCRSGSACRLPDPSSTCSAMDAISVATRAGARAVTAPVPPWGSSPP